MAQTAFSELDILSLGVGIVVLIFIFYIIGLYNRLITLSLRRDQAFSDIDVQLHQRYDLIPNLVETAKGYAAHESKTFETVTAARAQARDTKGAGAERMRSEGLLAGALAGFMAVAEAYPDLKADAQFQRLMAELSDIENKIAAARRFFNNATQEFNSTLLQFPTNVIGTLLNFAPQPFFEIEAGKDDEVRARQDVRF